MFKIKKKLIVAICLSLALISGCGQKENKPVHIFSAQTSSDTSQASRSSGSSSSAQSSVSASSADTSVPQSSAEQDPPEQNTASTAVPEEPPVYSSASEPETITEPPVNDTQTVVYNYDPKNSCTITFDGTSITVQGIYGDLFDGVVAVSPSMETTRSVENGILTCTLTPTSSRFDRGIGSFAILDKNRYVNKVFIDLSDGKVMFPDTSGLVQSNNKVVSSAVNASDAKVAQYITSDGSRDGIPQILDEIQQISNEICNGIDSDYEKLRAISLWVSDNIYYDHPVYNKGAPQYCLTLEYMLDNRSSICGGYSNMTSALCAAQGIRCLNISGMALNNGMCFLQNAVGGFHEWNVAEIDGRQIIIDTGWNSGKGINANGTIKSDPPSYKYFDISADVFVFDHKAQTAEYRDYWALVQ